MTVNLLGLDREALTDWITARQERPFRVKQLLNWIHQRQVDDFDRMTDISKAFRATLKEVAEVRAPMIIDERVSKDGTIKWLLEIDGGHAIETVFIPEDDRGTLCVSSQVGCIQSCPFCATGRQGFVRNLTAAEIVGQLWRANRRLSEMGYACRSVSRSLAEPDEQLGSIDRPVSNVVLMGMGEPLANADAVIAAVKLMIEDCAYGLSRRRVTVSTSGVAPAIDRLKAACPVSLAVSLHAPTDDLRDRLIPINRKYPLATLMAACYRYLVDAPKSVITIEYVMLDGVNDSIDHAGQLIRLLDSMACKINLIPFNAYPGSPFGSSRDERVRRFAETLIQAGFVATIRKSRGDDIAAACGQLAGRLGADSRKTTRLKNAHPL